MDPYLERHWRDIHTTLIAYTRDELNQHLPEDLIARAEENLAVEAESENQSYRRTVAPDVRVFEVVEDLREVPPAEGGVALAPFRLTLMDEPVVERHIEIIDARGGERVITVIEFLSPSNKGDEMDAFVQKRKEFLAGGVNFVEVDLIRAGDWKTLLGARCPKKATTTYRAVMRLPGRLPKGFLHPFSLREPLPTIKIPLRKGEPPAELPLQQLIDQVYRNGRYARTIDYRQPCDPPLQGEDATWADELLKAAGRR